MYTLQKEHTDIYKSSTFWITLETTDRTKLLKTIGWDILKRVQSAKIARLDILQWHQQWRKFTHSEHLMFQQINNTTLINNEKKSINK